MIPNLQQYLSKKGINLTSTNGFKDEKQEWWYFALPTHISLETAQFLGKENPIVFTILLSYYMPLIKD